MSGSISANVSRKNVCSILIETQGKVRINLLSIRFHRPMSMCPGIMFEYMSRKNVCSIAFCCGGDFGRPLVIRFHLQWQSPALWNHGCWNGGAHNTWESWRNGFQAALFLVLVEDMPSIMKTKRRILSVKSVGLTDEYRPEIEKSHSRRAVFGTARPGVT